MKRQTVVCALLVLAFAGVSEAQASDFEVKCDQGKSIQDVLDGGQGRTQPGDTIFVTGTCNEKVLVHSHLVGITLDGRGKDGQGRATIEASDPGRDAIRIEGRDITIIGFTVEGGSNGINVDDGSANILDNAVKGSNGSGIQISNNSLGQIFGNEVSGVGNQGLNIIQSSYAFIEDNKIQSNEILGVFVTEASAAVIQRNNISNNGSDGVIVIQNSHVNVFENQMDGNGGSGVVVSDLGNASLSQPGFGPNNTSPGNKNQGFGVQCNSGRVSGRLGTLDGLAGDIDVVAPCENAISP
jgi:parallel beta-helix repeat protein